MILAYLAATVVCLAIGAALWLSELDARYEYVGRHHTHTGASA